MCLRILQAFMQLLFISSLEGPAIMQIIFINFAIPVLDCFYILRTAQLLFK